MADSKHDAAPNAASERTATGASASMADASWPRVEELFFACSELDAPARAAHLERACPDDPVLRDRVERLLTAARVVGDRFEAIVRQVALDEATDAAESDADEVPQRLGPYRLGDMLGEGGMGRVYLGERADGAYEQRVAIKLVRGTLAGPLVARRFERERQILARLDHPAVARLLDGGSTDAGLPYLVMEYMHGEPIDAYCDHHQLPITARLALFREVCAGVQAAHGNLVVHRDIKPSNILVTADGQPKLLDFGISKLLEADDAVENTALTLLGQRVLTPEYASPEQVRDEPITTAVDIYALGLLLHRLLSGDRPYVLPTTRGEALRKVICETPAERPSATVARLAAADPAAAKKIAAARGTEPGRLRRRLSGDLDQIVDKALRKEPGQRYSSAEQLSADIGRHLDGLPVEARRGGWRYRAGRFVRRHRVGVAAALSAVLALTIGFVGQMREAARANREAARANLEAKSSAQVVDFLVRLFDASDPYRTGKVPTTRELLDRGVARIKTELADQPLLQAKLMTTLGQVYHNNGRFAEAQPLFASALQLRLQHLPKDDPAVATAQLNLADDLRVLGHIQQAMPHYEQAVAIRRAHFGDDSLELVEAQNNMALDLLRSADYARAGELLRNVYAIRKRRLGDDKLVAQSLHNLTLVASRRGDYVQAVALGQQTLALKRKVMRPDHPSRARTMALVAGAERELGNYDEAEKLLRGALTIMKKAWGEHHLDVLAAEGDLAFVRHLEGHWQEAEKRQREVLALKRQYLGTEHREVALTLDELGRQLEDQGKLADAETELRASLQMRQHLYPDDHPSVAHARYELGRLLLRRSQPQQAEPLLLAALAAQRKALPANHPAIADTLRAVARLRLVQKKPSAAVPLAQQGVAILRHGFPAGHLRIAEGRETLGECLMGAGRFAEAEKELVESRDVIVRKLGKDAGQSRDVQAALEGLYRVWHPSKTEEAISPE